MSKQASIPNDPILGTGPSISRKEKQKTLNECLGLASRLDVLQGVPVFPDKENSHVQVRLDGKSQVAIVLPLHDKSPHLVLLTKDAKIGGKPTKGWWLAGYVEADSAQMEFIGSDGEKKASVFHVAVPKEGFPRRVQEKDAELLERFAANGMPHPFKVFSCMYIE